MWEKAEYGKQCVSAKSLQFTIESLQFGKLRSYFCGCHYVRLCACARPSVRCHCTFPAQCASRRLPAGMLLSRARSWPLLSPPPAPPPPQPRATSAAVVPSSSSQTRRLLWRHYYPEGGWGWVVVGCSVGVHMLNHGLQLGGGAVLLSAAVTAFQSSDTDAGT